MDKDILIAYLKAKLKHYEDTKISHDEWEDTVLFGRTDTIDDIIRDIENDRIEEVISNKN